MCDNNIRKLAMDAVANYNATMAPGYEYGIEHCFEMLVQTAMDRLVRGEEIDPFFATIEQSGLMRIHQTSDVARYESAYKLFMQAMRIGLNKGLENIYARIIVSPVVALDDRWNVSTFTLETKDGILKEHVVQFEYIDGNVSFGKAADVPEAQIERWFGGGRETLS